MITKLSVEDFLMEIKKLPFKQNTIHAYGKRLNHFLNFLFEYDYIPMFKINRYIKTRPELVEKVVFSYEHLETIFRNLNSKNSNFQTLICLLAYTGLRSSDILGVKSSDVDFEALTMKYYSPKRKKYKAIAIKPELGMILSKRKEEVGDAVLVDYKNIEGINHTVTMYLKQIGLGGNSYTARTFRKTFITLSRNLYRMDATIVRELVGHEHGNTTDRFYNKISFDVQHEELQKFTLPISEWMKIEKMR
jgi:integrase